MGPARRRPRDPARGREGHAAPHVAAAPHRRAAAHEAARRREGVRRLRARVHGGSVDRGRQGAARGARAADRGRLGPPGQAVRGRARATKDLDPKLAHELATKVARSYEDRLGNSAKAVEFFKKALVDRARRPRARSRRSRRSSRATRSTPSCSTSIAVASTSRTSPTSASSSCSGRLRSTRRCSNAPDEAIAIYNEILGQAPDDLKALRALDRLYVQRQQWRDLGDNISRQLTLVEQPYEQVALLVRLAQLRETHLERDRGGRRDVPPGARSRGSEPRRGARRSSG